MISVCVQADCEYTDQGQVTCTCREGWTGDGEVCTEVDSCLLESRGGCHDDAECSSVGPGQTECTCKDGYQGDGKYCDLISPCIRYNGGCHYLATCEYSRNGTQSCTCPTGYEGNGTVCYGSIRMELDSNHQYYWFNELVQASRVDDLDRNITALIPANRGFYELGRIKREYWKDPYRTPYLVKAHILEGIYTSEDLRQLVNKKVTTLNSKTSWEITIADTMLKIGKATITKPDNLAINGLIHVIDTVLEPSLSEIPPPPPTLIEFLNNTPTYSLFMQALLLYNITDKVTAKENTILLPSDQAVKEHLQRTNSTQLDEDTAKYHIVPDVKLLPEDVLSGMTKKTLLGFHYQIMFHVGTKNESMANEVLLDGNVTEIRYAIVIPISRVLEIHKNYCNKEVFLRSSGRCGPCDEPPRCSYRGKPLGGGFPPGMKPNCQYRKRDGRIRYTASGCMIDCFRAEEQEECCPGFYGPTCYRCPATNDQVCSNRGKCEDGLLGTGACVCQQGFNGTACEKCEPTRYGASCQSVCNCVHGICADGITGDGKCLCHKGWKGPTCSVAIVADECGGTCDVNANCVAPSGSGPKCFCVAGYQGDGKVCKAINPCDHDNGSCSKDAKCTKISPGVRTCTCNQGYTGRNSVPGNRPMLGEPWRLSREGRVPPHGTRPGCIHENGGCSMNAWCENSGQGQRNCTCRKGYIGDGFTCKGKIATEIRRHPDASWFSSNLAAAKVGDLLGDGVYTLFVPHNDYASNFTMELWTNRSRNRDLLRNHIVGCEKLFLADLRSGGNVVTFAGQKLHFSVQKGDVYINEKTKIITSDEMVFDAVIHFIDGVLVPYDLQNQSKVDPSKFNVTSAAEAYGYTTFSKMLQDSSVQSLIQNPLHQPLSMLWPTEEAFRSMPEERRRWLFNPDHAHQLANYVKAHIIRDIILTAGMLPLTGSARTLFGSILSFSCDKNTVGNILVDDGNAKIIERHLEFDVGIAHGIDQLIEPPGLGARCDNLEMVKVSGMCGSCDLTPRCSHGMTFTGKVSSCVNYRPWKIHKLYRTYRPRFRRGCSAECLQVKWTPRCCKNHYGRDCEVCPGGLEAPCSNHGDCNDGEQGTGNCTCQPGFRGTACELCESGHYGPNCTACTCTENGRCAEQLDGDGSCFCHEGWTGARCEIKLEIKPNCTPTCHPKAVCQPENVCQCEPLYEGDGRTCTAPDLCREYNGGCHQNADCVQTGVQVTCTCRSGYWGDGVACAPINRCVQESNGGCSLFANCRFTGPNVRECECLPGYIGDGFQCLLRVVPPEDRCLEDNGGCDPKALCKDLHFHENTAGVFHLSSPKGRYKLNYKDARAACEGEDATLATLTQLSHAQQLGMHLCMAGWLEGAQVGFPTRFPSLICGNNRVGVVTYKSPVDTSSTYDAYCYRVKDVFCECGPQYVGSGEFCNGNLASVVATNAKFSVFYSTLLKLASSSKEGKRLMDFLTAPSVSITLFVPQDSGFIANQTLTWRDVEYHISTNNSLHFYGNLTHGSVLRSQLGFNLSVAISTNSSDESQPIKTVNRQRIIDWDIPTTNGIIHIIERPLKAPPPLVSPHHTAGDASTHSSGAAGPVFSHKKEPYKFHYFKAEEDIDDETRTDDEGGQKQDEGKPMQVSFANPVYRERPAAGQPFNEESSENVQEDSSESRNIFD
ncbi:hypothetical protein AGOR_G00132550 [Albula goreensis]|uniref:Stabilin-2 n=1 Tax=Albula goreensis TaxID=1534307 RepID=A0A8T3D411_9TELE|nr:hypothetical protein AGOR_G00132550 [Albula goreensis]